MKYKYIYFVAVVAEFSSLGGGNKQETTLILAQNPHRNSRLKNKTKKGMMVHLTDCKFCTVPFIKFSTLKGKYL